MQTLPSSEKTKRTNKQRKILYVDDDLQSRILVRHLIGKHYDLTICATAEEALALLNRNKYDLILLDIRLDGEINGIDLLNTIKALPHHNNTPVVAVTAFAFAEDKRYLLTCGFSDYISKPLNLNSFKEMVRYYAKKEAVTT
ncbi:response regulator [Candidatus Sulfidibacterium hydrothermale]|uniref:response regulator n=1 Tax=Candidatus Sulfidibacterium hydrothermale TaxID=2875962 RepID=UPI001F0B02B7|nr:response regulator [Candidatus Sulfidibacterium hydrothermale]UBM61417.1 response regulator [Candidatus Sulfidibacterium hydrothermale]